FWAWQSRRRRRRASSSSAMPPSNAIALRDCSLCRCSLPDLPEPPSKLRVSLNERHFPRRDVVNAADDVDLLSRVELLHDRRRALEPLHLQLHVFPGRALEHVAALLLLRDRYGRLERIDELGQMA